MSPEKNNFVSNELSGKKTRIIVKKGKGFNEIVTFENSNGEITNKFDSAASTITNPTSSHFELNTNKSPYYNYL